MTPQPLTCVAGNIGCARLCEWGREVYFFVGECGFYLEHNQHLFCNENKMNYGMVLIFRYTATHCCSITLCPREVVNNGVNRDNQRGCK